LKSSPFARSWAMTDTAGVIITAESSGEFELVRASFALAQRP
jgi:hypothetical protein